MQTCWRRILKTRSIKSSTLGQCTRVEYGHPQAPALEGQLFEIEKKSPGIIGPANDELQGRGFVHYGTKATSETARSGHQMICSKDGPRC